LFVLDFLKLFVRSEVPKRKAFNKSIAEAGKAACMLAAQKKHKACGGVQTEQPVSYKRVDTLGTKAVTCPKEGWLWNAVPHGSQSEHEHDEMIMNMK
jgi:hypothetical protein